MIDRLLDILFTLTCIIVAFIWGWVMRAIKEKESKIDDEDK